MSVQEIFEAQQIEDQENDEDLSSESDKDLETQIDRDRKQNHIKR
mgnify:FL=1